MIGNIVFLDIENTIIDDLVNRNFLEDNCERIKNWLKKGDNNYTVSFNTWGWTKTKEVDEELVKAMYDKLEVPVENRASFCDVLVKEHSVEVAIQNGWLNKEDKERAMFPGMMQEFGIDKISCFTSMVSGSVTNDMISDVDPLHPLTFWLIDDLVHEFESLTWFGGKLEVCVMNPKEVQ